ncbi:MAG TPA: hypothetical protein PLG34_06120 [Spirochaetota bacterium]|jgi:hypothetical protein|nr:MAG: hypothetical protein BWX91_01876 [Spirochaetes bacterium ADurb.Bin133]HPY87538.1 hypothetical protein [Spirochaetota bacterium]
MAKLLIAQVSRDVIVLAKLLEGLTPDYLLLFSTAYAKERWIDNRIYFLDNYKKNNKLSGYKIETLDNNITSKEIEKIGVSLDDFFKKTPDIEEVYFDTTTGLGMYRVLGYEQFKNVAEKNKKVMYLTHLDGDKSKIDIFKIPEYTNAPKGLSFDYGEDPLKSRIEIFNVDIEKSSDSLIYENGNVRASDVYNEFYKDFYEKLIEDETFRYSFISIFSLGELTEAYLKLIEDSKSVTIEEFIKKVEDGIQDIIHKNYSLIKFKDNKKIQIEIIKSKFLEILKDFLRYIKDKKLNPNNIDTSDSNNILSAFKRKKGDYIRRIPSALNINNDNNIIQAILKNIEKYLREQFNLLISDYTNRDKINYENFKKFFSVICQKRNIDYDDFIKINFFKKGFLFENLLSYIVLDSIDKSDKKNNIRAVYRNIKVSQRLEKNNIELDITIFLQNGDIVVIEGKSFIAEIKDMNSRLSVLKDIAGGYSKINIVHPFTKNDWEKIDKKEFKNDIIYNINDWQQYYSYIKDRRDFSIVGIDEIGKALRL